jgi:chromodomain-helicase-DNA-binding protein 4
MSKLHSQLQPHMLRRTKNEVEAAIPPKMEFILRVELSALQKQYYKAILTHNFQGLTKGAHTSLINILMELQKVRRLLDDALHRLT